MARHSLINVDRGGETQLKYVDRGGETQLE